ncbi:MAG TPA: hypothetical protein VF142_01825 [Longimicrobium sp.]
MGSTPASVGTLFMHIGVFALVTLGIYAACLLMIRLEDKRVAQRGRRS